jgi:hypothetical protein
MPGTLSRSAPIMEVARADALHEKLSNFQEDHGKEKTPFQKQKLALRDVNSFAFSTVLKQGFSGDGTVVSYLSNVRRTIMKLQWQ